MGADIMNHFGVGNAPSKSLSRCSCVLPHS